MPTPLQVLILEDRPDDAELVLRELRRAGYEPRWRRVETEAAFLAALAEPPDVILADYSMPQFDAARALALVKERELDIPFIIVSGTIGEDTAVGAMRAGAHDYIMKTNPQRLAPALDRELREAAVRRERKEADAALARQRQQYQLLANNAPDPIFLLDREMRATYVNPAIESATGLPRGALLGKTAREAGLPDDVVTTWEAFLQRVLDTCQGATAEIVFPGPKGPAYFENKAIPVLADGGTVESVLIIARDVTERKLAEQERQEQLTTLRTLYGSAQRVSQSLDLADLAGHMVETAGTTLGAKIASVVRIETDGTLRPLALYPGDAERPLIPTIHGGDVSGESLAAQAIRTAAPVVIKNIADDPRIRREHSGALQERGLHSAAGFPLISRATAFGALIVYGDRPGVFTPALVEFILALTNQVAAAMANVRLYEEAERRLRHLQTLRDIDTAITGSLDSDVILSVFLDKVTTQLRVDAAEILLFDPHSQSLQFAAERGFRSQALRHTRLRLGQGYAGQAALDRRTITVPNLEASPGAFTRSPLLPEEGFVAYFAIPLIAKGQIKGVLEIFNRTRISPDREWLDFLSTLAGQAAIAMDGVETFTRLQRANVDLMLAYDTTLEGWVHALDLRDEETEGHTQRVTELTMRLARALGFNEADLVHVRRGALLHDIGKMGIPDSILLKTGALSAEEMAIMRKHPVYAYDLLLPIAYLRPAIDIPHCHHERWDGSGYPRGLKGAEIPLAARIFAVVDVWDALRSDRPYRLAWPEEKVRSYLREQAGSHFEPEIVEAFLRMEELPRISYVGIRQHAEG